MACQRVITITVPWRIKLTTFDMAEKGESSLLSTGCMSREKPCRFEMWRTHFFVYHHQKYANYFHYKAQGRRIEKGNHVTQLSNRVMWHYSKASFAFHSGMHILRFKPECVDLCDLCKVLSKVKALLDAS